MRLLDRTGVVAGAIVPHAPALLPGLVAPEGAAAAARIRAACDRLELPDVDLVVVVSPHGRGTGIYTAASGSLRPFGVAGRDFVFGEDDEAGAALALAWKRPRSDRHADHGALVPLALVASKHRVVACSLEEVTGPGRGPSQVTLDETRLLAAAIRTIARTRRVAVVASAHTGAGLTPRAPLGERGAARELDDRIVAALRDDVAGLLDIPLELWGASGSCGVGPLRALGHLFTGPGEVLAYEHPYGVGYLVARTTWTGTISP